MLSRIVTINKNKKINIIINFNQVIGEKREKNDPHWLQFPDHLCRILRIAGSGWDKTNTLPNLSISISKKTRQKVGMKYFKDSMAFIEYRKDMNDVKKSIEDYNPGRKRTVLIVFDDMMTGMVTIKVLM